MSDQEYALVPKEKLKELEQLRVELFKCIENKGLVDNFVFDERFMNVTSGIWKIANRNYQTISEYKRAQMGILGVEKL